MFKIIGIVLLITAFVFALAAAISIYQGMYLDTIINLLLSAMMANAGRVIYEDNK